MTAPAQQARSIRGTIRLAMMRQDCPVAPNAAEVLVCALVEAITGEDIERHANTPAALAA